MWGGLLFIFVVWFLPLLIYYFVQGRKKFNKTPSCEQEEKEIKKDKYAFYGAIGFGLLIAIIVVLFCVF